MKLTNEQIKEILLKEGYVEPSDITNADNEIKRKKITLVDYLLSKELINNDLLGQAIAEHYQISYSDFNSNRPSSEQVQKIPQAIAEKYRVVIFSEGKKEVVVGTDDPQQKDLKEKLTNLFPNKKVSVTYALPQDIDDAFMHYRKPLDTRFVEIIKNNSSVAPEIINEIVGDAIIYRASDIHFEPQEENVLIRFRIDGVLHEAGRIPKENYSNVLNRIKIQAKLRIDEHFSTQDGAFRLTLGDKKSNMRVSVAPTVNGEKTVIRLLSEYVKGFSLADLGLSERNQKIISDVAHSPFGMILTTGPTGSGKTTTLYSLLNERNQVDVNITTIEDPVEFRIPGINQIQVNKETEITFARGLRSVMRQDPDIILVGEIRDRETAEIAVNAALTGHLLFSTFHANNSATAIPRLLDMGIERFLLASTLELVVSQRLVRKICESCRYSYIEKVANLYKENPLIKNYIKGTNITLYKGKGCSSCSNVGYKGRVGVFELLKMTPEMKDLILKNPSSKEIMELAQKQGTQTLFEDGIEKVKSGVTTLEELYRVAK